MAKNQPPRWRILQVTCNLVLGPHIPPLRSRIRVLRSTRDHSAEEVAKRIKMLHMAARFLDTDYFEQIASGLLKRKRLLINYYKRPTGETLQRQISPQRLVYYRDNWFLDETLGSSYGIFSGKPKHTAILRFSPERALWVSRENWQSGQTAETDREGYYLLSIPYSDNRELIMDILRHGQEVEVLKSARLRTRVAEELERALRQYK